MGGYWVASGIWILKVHMKELPEQSFINYFNLYCNDMDASQLFCFELYYLYQESRLTEELRAVYCVCQMRDERSQSPDEKCWERSVNVKSNWH